MSYTYDKRRMPTTKSEASQTSPTTRQSVPSAAVPNSAMLSMLGLDRGRGGGEDLKAAMRARTASLWQKPSAEREADTLSEGITARTPEQVKQEMGERLGSDFSSVRFHSDSSSVAQADSMGARAWAQGGDVYFGEGGFTPDVAAHELVHTVQQGVVSGSVSQSAPQGAVQMMPHTGKDKRNESKDNSNDSSNENENAGDYSIELESKYPVFSELMNRYNEYANQVGNLYNHDSTFAPSSTELTPTNYDHYPPTDSDLENISMLKKKDK